MIMADFRYAEDLPAQLINVPYTNTASKSAEEGKKEIPQKVSIVCFPQL